MILLPHKNEKWDLWLATDINSFELQETMVKVVQWTLSISTTLYLKHLSNPSYSLGP